MRLIILFAMLGHPSWAVRDKAEKALTRDTGGWAVGRLAVASKDSEVKEAGRRILDRSAGTIFYLGPNTGYEPGHYWYDHRTGKQYRISARTWK